MRLIRESKCGSGRYKKVYAQSEINQRIRPKEKRGLAASGSGNGGREESYAEMRDGLRQQFPQWFIWFIRMKNAVKWYARPQLTLCRALERTSSQAYLRWTLVRADKDGQRGSGSAALAIALEALQGLRFCPFCGEGAVGSVPAPTGTAGAAPPGLAAPEPGERILTTAEVSVMLRVRPETVRRWAEQGRLTAIRTLGGHRRFRESEVQALLGETSAVGPIQASRPDTSGRESGWGSP
jgi:excisionase family DNA binding protein